MLCTGVPSTCTTRSPREKSARSAGLFGSTRRISTPCSWVSPTARRIRAATADGATRDAEARCQALIGLEERQPGRNVLGERGPRIGRERGDQAFGPIAVGR